MRSHRAHSPRPFRRFRLVVPMLVLALCGCAESPESDDAERRSGRNPILVIGIDGAEWSVIEDLWERGELPAFRELAARGVTGRLKTDYGKSPVIWTTIATGVLPERHGIEDFVVPTDKGDVPVSSNTRKVPALWNMTSRTNKSTLVLGWWATWPGEPVNGVLVSDRLLSDRDRRTFPPAVADRVDELNARFREDPSFLGDNRKDQVVTALAKELLPTGFDLSLVYYRNLDIVSHQFWKYYEPEAFGDVPPGELERYGDEVPGIYRAVDQAVGEVVAAAPENANILVISDHGFHAAEDEKIRIFLDLGKLLEHLGYMQTDDDGVDFGGSRLYPFSSPDYRLKKMLRFSMVDREDGGTVTPEQTAEIRAALEADLAKISYLGGKPVFTVRDAEPAEKEGGADFVVMVRKNEPSEELLFDGEPLPGIVQKINRISGEHHDSPDGIFFAAGPDIRTDADLDGLSIHSITPTVLYGLGLPIAEDFTARPVTELFTEEFNARTPLRTVPTWGERDPAEQEELQMDEGLVDELRALGYLAD